MFQKAAETTCPKLNHLFSLNLFFCLYFLAPQMPHPFTQHIISRAHSQLHFSSETRLKLSVLHFSSLMNYFHFPKFTMLFQTSMALTVISSSSYIKIYWYFKSHFKYTFPSRNQTPESTDHSFIVPESGPLHISSIVPSPCHCIHLLKNIYSHIRC